MKETPLQRNLHSKQSVQSLKARDDVKGLKSKKGFRVRYRLGKAAKIPQPDGSINKQIKWRTTRLVV